jgi:leader peptidase (prepilin peptidase)/N-methyltransferase
VDRVLESSFGGPAGYVVAALFGALFGSFANVCILRIPAGKSIVRPGSHCFACGAPVRWYDNLPILSYLLLRGRCRACRASFSPRYLFVEIALAALFAAVWWLAVANAGDPFPHRLARFAIYGLFVLVLVIIAMIDLDTKLIPDVITYPGIPIFLGFGLLLQEVPWLELVIGVVVGYGVVWTISFVYEKITGRLGLGLGDGKLLALVGGLLGWRAVVCTLFLGSLLGSVISITILAIRREKDIRHFEVPFGPFLVGGAVIYLFLAAQIRVAFSIVTP